MDAAAQNVLGSTRHRLRTLVIGCRPGLTWSLNVYNICVERTLRVKDVGFFSLIKRLERIAALDTQTEFVFGRCSDLEDR